MTTMADSTGKIIALIQAMMPKVKVDPAVIEQAVSDWLDDHPEATTTVEDGSITEEKLAADVLAILSGMESNISTIADMGTNKRTGKLSPFVQGSISNGVINPESVSFCYIGPFNAKKDDTISYSRYNSNINFTNTLVLYNEDGTFNQNVSLATPADYTFTSDCKFCVLCGVNTGKTLENAILAANESFTVSLSEEPKIVEEVKKTDGKISTAVTAAENAIYPHIVGIKNYADMTDKAKAVIKSVVLYNPEPTATYCLVVMIAALDGTAKFEIYKMTDQMGFDSRVCSYNSTSFDGSKLVRLEQENNSGIHAEIALDFSSESSISISGVKYVIDPSAYRIERIIQTQNVLIPDNIYVLNGRPQQFFPKSLLRSRRKEGIDFDSNWEGYSESDKLGEDVVNIKYSASGADMTVTMSIVDKVTGQNSLFGKKTFHVNPIQAVEGQNKKVLCIGDSFMDYPWYTTEQQGHVGKGIMAFIKEYASEDNNVIDFIGTHLSYADNGQNYYSESYGGWSEGTFVDSSTHTYEGSQIYSPFYINGTACNFSDYFENLGETPDIVVFFVGMNGDYSATTGQAIQTMITGIKAVSASTKFIVCTIPGYFKNRYLYNYAYASGDYQKYMKNNAYYTLFDGAEDEGVYICPINAMWSSEHHYITADEAILRFNTDVKMSICRNHHPNQTGVQMIADAIYTVMQAILNA